MSSRREEFGESIVATEFDLKLPGGESRRVGVRVGKPYAVSALEWACPVELKGLESRYPDIRGNDSLQALCLALSLVRMRLQDIVEEGGKVLNVGDGSECSARDLAAMFGWLGTKENDAG